ncbi:MAG: DUF1934 domain-containing protein [Erysipelotrichaceae bacterium]|nr:DUF1934 domain-containing protein [Erysipelotrichaceae bacterium]
MVIKVKLTQYDLLDDKNEVLLESKAIYDKTSLKYIEDSTHAKHEIYFEDDHIILNRNADIQANIVLHDSKLGEGIVDSPYGRMTMQTKLIQAQKCDEYWMIEYQLLMNDEIVLHRQLRWNFTF